MRRLVTFDGSAAADPVGRVLTLLLADISHTLAERVDPPPDEAVASTILFPELPRMNLRLRSRTARLVQRNASTLITDVRQFTYGTETFRRSAQNLVEYC